MRPIAPMVWVMALVALSHVCFTGIRFSATLFAIEMHASPATVGMVGAAFAVLPMISSVLVGRIADRFGARGPIVLGSLVMTGAGLMTALAPSVGTLLIGGTLLGGFYNMSYISAMQAMNRMGTPTEARQAVVNVSLAFGVTGFISPLIGGFGIDTFGHARTILGFALVPLITFGAFAFWRMPLPPGQDRDKTREPSPGGALQLLRDPKLLRIYIVLTALSAAWDVFNIMMPIQGTRLGLPASRIGILFGVFVVGTFTVRIALTRLYETFGPWQILIGSVTLAGLSYLGLIVAGSMATLLPLVLLLGMALGAQLPVSVALIFENAPKGRSAEAFGLRVTLVTSSQTVLPLLAGALGATAGLAPVFLAVAASLLGIGWRIRRHARHGMREDS